MKRNDDDLLDDVIQLFSRVPVYLPLALAAITWLVLTFLLKSSTFGIMFAVLIVLTGMAGWRVAARSRDLLDRSRTLQGIQDLSWREFENLAVELFRREGYRVERTSTGSDGGVDHILRRNGETVYVQAKHWRARKVPLGVVQRTFGIAAADGAHQAIVVTCGAFSPEAIRFARNMADRVHLIDGDELLRRLASKGLTGQDTVHLPVAAAPQPLVSDESCPQCTSAMTPRRGRFGPFLGCTRYPACRGTRPLVAG